MPRSSLLAAAAVAALALPATAKAFLPGLGGWNRPDQHEVAQAGVLHVLEDHRFHGERPLAGDQLRQAVGTLAERLQVPPVAAPRGRVSVAAFDGLLVRQLGLADVAAAVQHQAWKAGLQPPARFGTEVVARQLGLRFNHPAAQDRVELFPTDAITRAEAAYSFARVLGFDGWEVQEARDVLSRFVLPAYTARQRRALRVAVSKIGMPYVWGGEADTSAGLWGTQAHGGYDCSGFVWRVFKNTGLVHSIRGRTAAQMAGEIPRSQRLALSQVRPGDVLFFGPGRFWQKATERRIVHAGIALGAGFMIHSSSQGVYVSELSGWRLDELSWARRVL